MQRIVILGCSGTGKSTFARRLGERLGLPVVHLDALFWEPGWIEAETEVFRERVARAVAGDRWVCDGNYLSRTADLTLPPAQLVIWLDQPVGLRLWRVCRRAVTCFGRTRADMGPGCPEKVDFNLLRYIWDFDRKSRPRMEEALRHHAPQAPVVRLNGSAPITAFLTRVRALAGP